MLPRMHQPDRITEILVAELPRVQARGEAIDKELCEIQCTGIARAGRLAEIEREIAQLHAESDRLLSEAEQAVS